MKLAMPILLFKGNFISILRSLEVSPNMPDLPTPPKNCITGLIQRDLKLSLRFRESLMFEICVLMADTPNTTVHPFAVGNQISVFMTLVLPSYGTEGIQCGGTKMVTITFTASLCCLQRFFWKIRHFKSLCCFSHHQLLLPPVLHFD